jgi:membrane protein implicated in regulation of membrane protease activity
MGLLVLIAAVLFVTGIVFLAMGAWRGAVIDLVMSAVFAVIIRARMRRERESMTGRSLPPLA